MGTFNFDEFLTLEELVERINVARLRYAPVRATEEVQLRTVRYYAELGLLPNVSRGPGRKYPADFLWKILFIRLLVQREQLKLAHIKKAMRHVAVETMRRVVTGEESLEIAAPGDAAAIARHARSGYQVVAIEPVTGTPEKVLDDEAETGWLTLLDEPKAMLRVRADLSPAARRQLQQLAGLIASIVEEPPPAPGQETRGIGK